MASLLVALTSLVFVGCGGGKKETVNPKKFAQKASDDGKGDGKGDSQADGKKVAKADAPDAKPADKPEDKPAEKPADAKPADKPAATPADTSDDDYGVRRGPPPKSEVKRALSMVRSGRYLDAIRESKQALKKSEKYTPAMEVLARAYFHLKKYEFAEAICDTAIGLEPKSGHCFALKGHVALALKDQPLALKHFKKATEVAPSLGPAWLNLGALYLRVKNYREAEPTLKKAVELMGARAEAHLNYGAALRGNNKVNEALASFNKALKLRTDYPAALFNLGLLYLDAKKVPSLDRMQQLKTAENYLQRHKSVAGRNLHPSTDTYLQAAAKAIKREVRRLKREERRRKRAERRKAREAKKKADAATKAAEKKAGDGKKDGGKK
jgi:tetratricopeptide (TPR) repeat protein